MAVRQAPENEWTKDGRKWMFEVRVTNSNGKKHHRRSGKYLTKKEAVKAEKAYIEEIESSGQDDDMTFKELCEKHFEF